MAKTEKSKLKVGDLDIQLPISVYFFQFLPLEACLVKLFTRQINRIAPYLLMVTYGPLLPLHDTAIIDDDWKGRRRPSCILLRVAGTTSRSELFSVEYP